ncbi:exosortase N [Tellurirhabdus bombi]|uniref:exosortase N n=1 Tax=Tellurirhabdus bombi TaxID=2907205 RepID=UPI001F39EE5C|nr:exosortase N [Tellurirhabdus bombi]
MPATDLTFWLGLALAAYVLLTPARQRWVGMLAALVVTSPMLRWAAALFSFPIRLELSRWAGHILCLGGANAQVYGNIIRFNGTDFSVDPACMGVQMTGLSLLAGLFLIIHTENQTKRRLTAPGLLLAFLGLVTFTIAANLVRILALVLFHVLPDNPLHDVVGLSCWLLYVALPLNWSIAVLYRCFSRPIAERPATKKWLMAPIALCGLCLAGFALSPKKEAMEAGLLPSMRGYTQKYLQNGFVQYSKPGVLVYAKPIATPWTLEHSPYNCWRGSGYEFAFVQERQLASHSIYAGTLRHGKNRMHTAWWFTDGLTLTTSQLETRWQMIRDNRPSVLINVTVENPSVMPEVLDEWRTFRPQP